MKSAFLSILLLLSFAICFGMVIQGVMGLDLPSSHKGGIPMYIGLSDTHNFNVEMGFSPSLELLFKNQDALFGAGIEYQLPRKVTFGDRSGKIAFIPIYGTIHYLIPSHTLVKPELIGQLGYNVFTADDNYKGDAVLTGGLYWGVGVGTEIKNLIFQLIYKNNYGSWKQDVLIFERSSSVTKSHVNLSLGVRF